MLIYTGEESLPNAQGLQKKLRVFNNYLLSCKITPEGENGRARVLRDNRHCSRLKSLISWRKNIPPSSCMLD